MTTGLALGCLLGASICALGLALRPPRPGLASAASRYQRVYARSTHIYERTQAGGEVPPGIVRGAARDVVMRIAGHLPDPRADLEITDRTLEHHVANKVALGVGGFVAPAVLAGLAAALGAGPNLSVSAAVALLLGAVLFWLPDLRLKQEAAVRRHDLRRALACYLDLVSMTLAGGRGVPEALPGAARIGSGWAFSLIQLTLERARYAGMTPWAALAQLGERIAVPELQDLGGSLQLVSDDGAKVRASLSARASTQRRRQLAEAEGEAATADQSIQMAQVILAVGFFIFLGYPAVVAVMGI